MRSSITARPERIAAFQQSVRSAVKYALGRSWGDLTALDLYEAVSLAVREWTLDALAVSDARCLKQNAKRAYLVSHEFLPGRLLAANLAALGETETCRQALLGLGQDLEAVLETEREPGLGRDEVGRHAAGLIEALAAQGFPAIGYGIAYDYGRFRQGFDGGCQSERPVAGPETVGPWRMPRRNEVCRIPLYGRTTHRPDVDGNVRPLWLGTRDLIGVPHDVPIVGAGGEVVNRLRLFAAHPSDAVDRSIFDEGDYIASARAKISEESVSRILYPARDVEHDDEARLVQEAFLAGCAVRDVVRTFELECSDFNRFPQKVALQICDTEPALIAVELLRLLIDERDIPWERAWTIARDATGLTLLQRTGEATGSWSVALLSRVLPRHLEIMEEVERRFLTGAATRLETPARGLVGGRGPDRRIDRGRLAALVARSVTSVCEAQDSALRRDAFSDIDAAFPGRFGAIPLGVSPRRWITGANPDLAELLDESLGPGWDTRLERLSALEEHAEQAAFRQRFRAIKQRNKQRLADTIRRRHDAIVDPESLFDVHLQPFEAHERQLLLALHVMHLYLRIVDDGIEPETPRTVLFCGKAAPGSWEAKQVVRLVHDVAMTIDGDPRVRDRLRVVFLPDDGAPLAEWVTPAADLGEHVATAGTHACGAVPVRLGLNGALLVATLDGVVVQVAARLGLDGLFLFGHRDHEVEQLRRGGHVPANLRRRLGWLNRLMDEIAGDRFCRREPGAHQWIAGRLMDEEDPHVHLADLASYVEAQQRAGLAFRHTDGWARRSIINVARLGAFSLDVAARQLAGEVWGLRPLATSSGKYDSAADGR